MSTQGGRGGVREEGEGGWEKKIEKRLPSFQGLLMRAFARVSQSSLLESKCHVVMRPGSGEIGSSAAA